MMSTRSPTASRSLPITAASFFAYGAPISGSEYGTNTTFTAV